MKDEIKNSEASMTAILKEIERVLQLESEALLAGIQTLKEPLAAASLKKAIDLLCRTRRLGGKVVTMGVGKSGQIAKKIAATFSSTGTPALFLHPTEMVHGDLGFLGPHDLIFAMSHRGNTEEILRLLPIFKTLSIPVIGLGGFSKSQLASQCDAWIDARIEREACFLGLAPTTSTTLALALGDALAMVLMQCFRFTEHSFQKFHPGGTLGRRLSYRVQDLMKQGSALAWVAPNALMDEVVSIATEKKLGAVLVGTEQQWLGLITDGDLRRALKQKERFFQFTAQEIMTLHPVVVQVDADARVALKLMEERASQISVLPVVNSQQHLVGLLRLHDLVQFL